MVFVFELMVVVFEAMKDTFFFPLEVVCFHFYLYVSPITSFSITVVMVNYVISRKVYVVIKKYLGWK